MLGGEGMHKFFVSSGFWVVMYNTPGSCSFSSNISLSVSEFWIGAIGICTVTTMYVTSMS